MKNQLPVTQMFNSMQIFSVIRVTCLTREKHILETHSCNKKVCLSHERSCVFNHL